MTTDAKVNKPVCVVGGTGHYGQAVVRALLSKNIPVRILTRQEDKARMLFGQDIAYTEGDILDIEKVRQFLLGSSGIIYAFSAFHKSTISDYAAIEKEALKNTLKTAIDLQIVRFVSLSVYDIRPELIKKLKIDPLAGHKIELEDQIKQSGLSWTILGCAPSYALFFSLLRGKRLIGPGGIRNQVVSIFDGDVGRMAAEAVLRDELSGFRLRLNGPETFNFREVAQRFSVQLDLKIRYLPVPLWPVRLVSQLAKPFNPLLSYIYMSIQLLNHFPADLAEDARRNAGQIESLFQMKLTSLEEAIAQKKDTLIRKIRH